MGERTAESIEISGPSINLAGEREYLVLWIYRGAMKQTESQLGIRWTRSLRLKEMGVTSVTHSG